MEDARKECRRQGPEHEIPDGFVRIVQMRPARANATHVQQQQQQQQQEPSP